jgi:hypothetical protein
VFFLSASEIRSAATMEPALNQSDTLRIAMIAE